MEPTEIVPKVFVWNSAQHSLSLLFHVFIWHLLYMITNYAIPQAKTTRPTLLEDDVT